MTNPAGQDPDTSIENPPRSFASQVALIARLLRKRFDERARTMALAGEGSLTQAQWRALASIYVNAGCTQKELAERLDIGPVAIGQTVDRLERLQWIERRRDPGDRRVNRLHVTAVALPVLQRLGVLANSEDHYASLGVAPEKMKLLTALLDEVIADLTSASDHGTRT
ncbi:MarR family transcriptional regulator [uncultured Sphingomonas sp.]|uniref:MarR family winged helix-turn-helix transcriptional regulator n=1 Tax=uncultured Sphingomonas sp. TaxID=158754 RepID=UPI002594DAD2|nr:MarR family transcriptional regulator [uncultured Sphingomonas sp.]